MSKWTGFPPLAVMTPTIVNPASKVRRGMRFYFCMLAWVVSNPAAEDRYKLCFCVRVPLRLPLDANQRISPC